jgi:hypothetical protein
MTYIIGLGTPIDPKSLELQTRAKRHINNAMQPEKALSQMREAIRLIKDSYPQVQPVAASAIYNCYGMVFAARRTAIVDEEDVDAILRDDGYRDLPWDPSRWLVGDVVLYRDEQRVLKHVGMIAKLTPNPRCATIDVDVLSTWGQMGEYIHPIDVVSPLLGRPCQVVSQRFL